MLAAMQGLDPFADQAPAQRPKSGRYIPNADKLPPLTPEAFDAMFPGKPSARRVNKGKRPRV